jgi:hypothetical protein
LALMQSTWFRSSVAVAQLVLTALAGCGARDAILETPPETLPGYCAKRCKSTLDCCPAGLPNCPGSYPENFVCEAGLCKAPQCQEDSDCALSGGSTLVCRSVGGHIGCVFACSTDGECSSLGTLSAGCSRTADDGTRICGVAANAAVRCTSDVQCPLNRHCQSGACGCETDAECGPSLDVCTKDRDFAYPPSAAPGKP